MEWFFIGLMIGLLLGIALTALYFLRKNATDSVGLLSLKEEKAALQARLHEKEEQIQRLTTSAEAQVQSVAQQHETIRALERSQAHLESDLKNQAESMQQKIELLNKAEKVLQDQFKALSADALNRNNQAFLELAQTKLGTFQKEASSELEKRKKAVDDLVKPIHDSLKRVDNQLLESEKTRTASQAALQEQIKGMISSQQHLKDETSNLVRALRTPNVRGRWGEIQLRRVVEMAGMLNHCDFDEQETTEGEEGRLRPDLVVHLPGGKHVIVDAKTPLDAYLTAVDSPDDEARDAALQHHSRQVRDHITKLGSKSYWSQFEATPEFVVMFLPGETFFSAALSQDPGLIEFGVDQKVIPASPTTLIALLRAVAYGWQQDRIAENAQAISDLGRDLYERICVMTDHFNRVGKGLRNAVESYNKTVTSLESRALVTARRFRDLGSGTTRDLPSPAAIDTIPRILEASEEEGSAEVQDTP